MPKEEFIRVFIGSDDDGHNYIIPLEKKDRFYILLNLGEEGEDEFIIEFSGYMTGGGLDASGVELYALKSQIEKPK